MSVVVKKIKTSDWYECACADLEALIKASREFPCEDDVAPSAELYAAVTNFFAILKHTNLQNMQAPTVWLSDDGEIGLSWKTSEPAKRLDILFSCPNTVTAVLKQGRRKQKELGAYPVIDLIKQYVA
jgi:hypothetical protein